MNPIKKPTIPLQPKKPSRLKSLSFKEKRKLLGVKRSKITGKLIHPVKRKNKSKTPSEVYHNVFQKGITELNQKIIHLSKKQPKTKQAQLKKGVLLSNYISILEQFKTLSGIPPELLNQYRKTSREYRQGEIIFKKFYTQLNLNNKLQFWLDGLHNYYDPQKLRVLTLDYIKSQKKTVNELSREEGIFLLKKSYVPLSGKETPKNIPKK